MAGRTGAGVRPMASGDVGEAYAPSVVHPFSYRSPDGGVVAARRACAAGAVVLAIAGAYLPPLALVGLLVVVPVGLTAFEGTRPPPGRPRGARRLGPRVPKRDPRASRSSRALADSW